MKEKIVTYIILGFVYFFLVLFLFFYFSMILVEEVFLLEGYTQLWIIIPCAVFFIGFFIFATKYSAEWCLNDELDEGRKR